MLTSVGDCDSRDVFRLNLFLMGAITMSTLPESLMSQLDGKAIGTLASQPGVDEKHARAGVTAA